MNDTLISTPPEIQPEGPKKNNTIIIVAVVAVVLICCCCAFLGIAWFTGDYVIQALGL